MSTRDPKTGKFLKRMKDALQNSDVATYRRESRVALATSKPATLQLSFTDPVKLNVVPAAKTNVRQSTKRSTTMASHTTIVGNLTADPELRITGTGKSVLNFTLAYNPRRPDGSSGETQWYECVVWEHMAENFAASFKKGDRLVAMGRLTIRKYEHPDGSTRTKTEVICEEVAGSIRFHTVEMSRTKRPVPVVEVEETESESEDIFS